MNSKICMFTSLNHAHIKLYVAFIKSFLHHNKWFNYDFIILDIGLSHQDKQIIEYYYSKVIFITPDKSKYENVNFDRTRDRLKITYFKLEVFNLREYDRVVAIDMDMLVLADLKEIFECQASFAACRAYDQNHDKIMNTINSGLFVINNARLSVDTYDNLIKVAERGHAMPDQQTLILYFKNKTHFLNKSYNVEKRILKTTNLKYLLKSVKIWHYISDKPFEKHTMGKEKGFEEIENLWWSWYSR